MRSLCHKGQGNRTIGVSHRLRILKQKARERLLSEEGVVHRKKKPVDVEPVFGMLKQNMNFRRFLLKGLAKVNIEFGLLSLAHNLKKIAALVKKNAPFNDLWRAFAQSNYCYNMMLKVS